MKISDFFHRVRYPPGNKIISTKTKLRLRFSSGVNAIQRNSKLTSKTVRPITRDLEIFPVPIHGRFPDLPILIHIPLPSLAASGYLPISNVYSRLTVTRSCRTSTCFPFNTCLLFKQKKLHGTVYYEFNSSQ